MVAGKSLDELISDWGRTWRRLTSDSQLRWVAPEKGVVHMALGSVVNSIWDLWAKCLGKPLWRLVAEIIPEELVRCIDFLTDVLTPMEAVQLLKDLDSGKEERIAEAMRNWAIPAYTTSAGWLGYGEEKMKELLNDSINQGYKYFKLKVGANLDEDRRRLTIAREIMGYDKGNTLMIDANQVWSVPEAV